MNIKDKHIVITGATAGIGKASALAFGRCGARLTLLCRNASKGQAVCDEIVAVGAPQPELIVMDMASLDSVKTAASELLGLGRPIHVLLNNAGIVNTSRRVTVDGFEETLAVNHVAPFLLTGMVLEAMQGVAGARIVNVASDAHAFVRSMGFDDMQAESSYKTFREYGRSKLANILFTRELAGRLEGKDMTVNCLHPGAVATSLASQNEGMLAKIVPMLLKPFFRSPQKGAETSIYLCTSDEVATTSGGYFANCRELPPKPWARDDEAAKQLWAYTEDTLGYQFPVGTGSTAG